jgi:hypothetical protein
MRKAALPRGALLNTVTVIAGASAGLALGRMLDAGLQTVAITALGLVTVGMGIKMFLAAESPLAVAGVLVAGGLLGKLAGLDVGLDALAAWMRGWMGGGEGFNEGLVTATVLFCVGPMTLMGCLEDGLEGKLELIGLKSLLDGVAALFLAAASAGFGRGVLASAVVVLAVQSALTLLAGRLRGLAADERLLSQVTGTGGPMLLAIGLNLLGLAKIRSEVFFPALLLAPVPVWIGRRIASRPSSR